MAKDLSSLKKLLAHNTIYDIKSALHDVVDQTDRGAMIVMAAQVERSLQSYISTKFSGNSDILFAEHRPLYSFDAKIVVGLSFDLYGQKTFHALQAIKELRNFFAHAPSAVTFETSEIITFSKRIQRSVIPPLNAQICDGLPPTWSKIRKLVISECLTIQTMITLHALISMSKSLTRIALAIPVV